MSAGHGPGELDAVGRECHVEDALHSGGQDGVSYVSDFTLVNVYSSSNIEKGEAGLALAGNNLPLLFTWVLDNNRGESSGDGAVGAGGGDLADEYFADGLRCLGLIHGGGSEDGFC